MQDKDLLEPMSKTALAYITMNAGIDIPGSILQWALTKYHKDFDYSVVVDGHLTEEAGEFYKTIPGLIVMNSPWTGRHVDQYYARNQCIGHEDWVLALDDDEYPSQGLINASRYLRDNNTDYNIFYTPSLTYLCLDKSDKFYRVQTDPTAKDLPPRSKRILYKKDASMNYFIRSPCGMHVTPTQVINGEQDEKPAAHHQAYFVHAKTIESFILNECIYVVSNPRHEAGPAARRMTKEQEDGLVHLVHKYNLGRESFIEITKNHTWPEDFKDFVYQFRNDHGQSMCKFYYLYEMLSSGKTLTDDDRMNMVNAISTGFMDPLVKAIAEDDYITLPHTPCIWQ